MDPNSAHQLWAKWLVVVRPSLPMSPACAEVQAQTARFVRKGWGTHGQMRIRQFPRAWVFEWLVEGDRHPHDRATLDYFSRALTQFMRQGFGAASDVTVKARLMAGARLDRRPADQMVVLPPLLQLADQGVM